MDAQQELWTGLYLTLNLAGMFFPLMFDLYSLFLCFAGGTMLHLSLLCFNFGQSDKVCHGSHHIWQQRHSMVELEQLGPVG